MMKKWMSAMMAAAFVVSLVLLPKPADACSCMPSPGPAEEMERQEFVFSGEVVEIEEPAVVESSGDPVTVHFEVDTVWKGEIGAQTQVWTAYSSATCGFHFEVGQQYIVYGTIDEEGGQHVGLCSRTAPLDQAAEDLSILGEGVKPGDDEGEADPVEAEEPTVEAEEPAEPGVEVEEPAVEQPVPVDASGISIVLEGERLVLDVPPFLHNGVTYVPVRAAEAIDGIEIGAWDSETKSVTIRHESGAVLTLRASSSLSSDVQALSLAEGEPVLVDGRIMVPVRFIAESLGLSVSWDGASKTVSIQRPVQ
ncbi:stalk domain-containing protein [Paenibacillus sp. 1P07SE]|uniref:stalk domain-containing protein n=1 Tax=Paenibacillus sp. 1P07SE TaxID=3132209 RepID=UPI0039A47AD7